MTKFKTFLVAALLLSVGCFLYVDHVDAQSDLTTNSEYGWVKKYQSESAGLPEGSSPHKIGWMAYTISYDRKDSSGVTTGTIGAHATGKDMPDNAVVMQGVVDVITAFLPLTNTVAISLQSADDVLAATTNLNSTGIKACVPVDTAATAIKMTAARDLTITTAGDQAYTQGVAKVWIKYYLSQ